MSARRLRALDCADALGVRLLHCMAGIPPDGTSGESAAAVYAANLDWAAEQAHPRGVLLTIEPINRRDVPGYFLETLDQAARHVADARPRRLGLQFDVYHCQVTEGRVIEHLQRFLPIVAHVQIADAPGRHEPGTGGIPWREVLGMLDALGYDGWIGCEYHPAADTISGLAWRESVLELDH